MRKKHSKKRKLFLLGVGLIIATLYVLCQLAIFQFPSRFQHDPQPRTYNSQSHSNSKDSADQHAEVSNSITNGRHEQISELYTRSESIRFPEITNASSRDIRASVADILPSNLHIFYYAWYGSPAFDGRWLHWDHKVCYEAYTKGMNASCAVFSLAQASCLACKLLCSDA